jgi:hypothetical protein
MNLNIICILIVTLLIVNVCSASSIVYVDTDGSGDYNCDGTDDHIQINQALDLVRTNDDFTTVYLKGPNTYLIDATLIMGNHTIFEGDSDAVVTIPNEADWGPHVPLIVNHPDGGSDFMIQGFKIDGNSENQSVPLGSWYYTMIHFTGGMHNVTIQNMYLHHGSHDGLRIKSGKNVIYQNNTVYKIGHDALFCRYSSYITACNNDIYTRCNAGLRMANTNHVDIFNNTIHSWHNTQGKSTGPGIEIEKSTGYTMDDIEIYNNTIHTLEGSGIWVQAYDTDGVIRSKDIHIHHNTFYDVGHYWKDTGYSNAAITIGQFNNTIIENNVIDNGGRAGIKSYMHYNKPIMNEQFIINIRNNVIMNSNIDMGYGLWNALDINHIFISENNCIYNSIGGAYGGNNITATNDIQMDPLFVDPINHDYHPKSNAGRWFDNGWITDDITSPLIDAGHTPSDYSNEPDPNGDIINIGRYGNTIYASKSPYIIQTHNPIDSRLKEAIPDTVLNKSTFIDVGIINHIGKYRNVLLFDLLEYNSTDVIESATLSLFWYYETASRNQSTNVSIYRPMKWDEQYVTWNSNKSCSSWDSTGGDWYDSNELMYGLNSYDSIIFDVDDLPSNTFHNFDVTELIQRYVDDTYQNTGFLLKTDEISNDYIAFYSQKYQDETKRPKLTITLSTGSIPDPSNTWAIFCNWYGISETVVTPSNTELSKGWNMLYVMGDSNRTILDIKADIGDNCINVSAYNVTIGDYTYDDTYTLQPNECFLAEISNDMTWGRSLF